MIASFPRFFLSIKTQQNIPNFLNALRKYGRLGIDNAFLKV